MRLLKRIWWLALATSAAVGVAVAELVRDAVGGVVASVGVALVFIIGSWELEPFVRRRGDHR